ncbi:MAG: hypothetical protein AM325_001495 [Candidatus Thorarchaeota archaeon SMTZ1-45]
MGSIWFSKKAFLYFGGAAIILIGGAIVLMAPYHYVNYAVIENDHRSFSIWDSEGYYPQLEVSVQLRVSNSTTVEIGIILIENTTLDVVLVNLTLDQDNIIETPDALFLQGSTIVDIPFGNYTAIIDQINGAGMIDLGFNQVSNSRLFIIAGGSMNIIGLIMGISGYFVPGTFLPTDTDTIVEWGYEEQEEVDSSR